MSKPSRDFVTELGGYREVATRVGVSAKTMHSHITSEKFPPRWYVAFCELAREKNIKPPATDIFDFKPLRIPAVEDVA